MSSSVVSPLLAGRAGELAVLTEAFDAAAGGKPTTVLVGGEAGGGKSRLAAEFAARVQDRAMVLAGGCVELAAGTGWPGPASSDWAASWPRRSRRTWRSP